MFAQKTTPDTSEEALHRLMENAVVKGTIVEVLMPNPGNTADPLKGEMGKKKNHWVFRFTISKGIPYHQRGIKKLCLSVRASVEHPPGSLNCPSVKLRPMANDQQISNSAIAHFGFRTLRRGLTVKDFIREASCLLPFKYVIVAKSLVPAAPSSSTSRRGGSGRSEDLQEHPNGCRDFTAQWFYRLHRAGYISWETHDPRHVGGLPVVQNSEAFHDLIGYRYSPGRVDVCPIVMAEMPPNQRFLNCEVALEYNPNVGTPIRNARDEFAYHVKLPYQSTQPPVQVFRPATAAQGNSARSRAGGSRR